MVSLRMTVWGVHTSSSLSIKRVFFGQGSGLGNYREHSFLNRFNPQTQRKVLALGIA